MAASRPAALREEDHPLGVARDLGEVAHHRRLVAPAGSLGRDRRPHPLVELAAELLDQPLLVLGDLEVALGEQHVAVPRLHADELHG